MMYHYRLSFMTGAHFGEKLYFSDSFINALCVADISTGSCTYLGKFPDEKSEARLLHCGAFVYKDRIIFAPRMGKHIHSFDLKTKEIQNLMIKTDVSLEAEYVFSFLTDNKLWLFPQHVYQHIVSCDLDTGGINLYDSFQSMGNIDKSESGDLSYSGYGNKVYAVIGGSSIVFEFDLFNIDIMVSRFEIGKIFQIHTWTGEIWICTSGGIYKLNKESQNYDRCDVNGSIECAVLFYDELSKDIYAMSAIGGFMYKYNGASFVKCSQVEIERSPTYTDGYMYGGYNNMNGGIFVFPPYGKKGVFIKNGELVKKELRVENEMDISFDEKTAFFSKENNPIYEKGPIKISEYISLLCK